MNHVVLHYVVQCALNYVASNLVIHSRWTFKVFPAVCSVTKAYKLSAAVYSVTKARSCPKTGLGLILYTTSCSKSTPRLSTEAAYHILKGNFSPNVSANPQQLCNILKQLSSGSHKPRHRHHIYVLSDHNQ